MKSVVILLLFICCCNCSLAEEIDGNAVLIHKIDRLFERTVFADSPGCSVGLIHNHKLIFDKSYGLANLEYKVPLTSTSVHRIASVSKQFTALAVLLLADDGLIDLEDDIRTYLTDLNDYGEKVTINAMLGHFSGMGDFGEQWHLLENSPMASVRLGSESNLTIREYYDVIKSLPLLQKPNTSQKYSNFAYFLLSMLVEKVSGDTLRVFADKRIFQPLNMKSTFFADNGEELIPNRASGYRSPNADQYLNHTTNLFAVGDGGLHTTIEDMVKWDQHFYAPKLGKSPKKLIELMNTPNSNHGNEEDSRYLYANGQYVDTGYKHGYSYEHSGGWMGTATIYIRRPALKTSVIIFCNNARLNAADYAFPILDIVNELHGKSEQ